MLDAVRVAGRWISKPLLDRLTARAQGPNPPTRHAMLKEFCRLAQWFDGKGRPCLSSANVGIGRLEKSGWVKFPPAAPSKARSSPRKLWDDGLALPPLAKLPQSVELIDDLHLYLIADDRDLQHGVWNRLICREHPLKDAPLVGAQLRYLILAGSEVVGAFGFGPASFYLSCRDSWIGWDAAAMEQNRQKVICLSRFLIRPGLRCANLATSCYGMVLKGVRANWEQRYGIVPVLVFENLIAPHQENTLRRMAAESVVLLAQDTTPLSYNSLKHTQGLGPIGNGAHPGRGLLLHSLQAFRLDGIPLGCAGSKVWARESDSDTPSRNQQSIDQKESTRWLDAYQSAAAAAAQMPQTTIVVCGDRESDIIDLFDRSEAAPAD